MPVAKNQKKVASRKASPTKMSSKMSKAASKKQSPAKAPVPKPGAIAKKRPAFSKEANLQLYIFRILKKVHPEVGISKTAMLTVNSIILDLYSKISRAAVQLSMSTKSQTLSANDIQSAVKLAVPGELARLAISEGAKAVTLYNQN